MLESDRLRQIMADSTGCNALLFQMALPGREGVADYSKADAIIQKTGSPIEDHWAFYTIVPMKNHPVLGTGMCGDLESVTRAAHYQFGATYPLHEAVPVMVDDPLFPCHLALPH